MELDLQKRILIGVSIAVAIVIVILLLILQSRKTDGENTGATKTPETGTSVFPSPSSNVPSGQAVTPGAVTAEAALPAADVYLLQIATIFVERFHSYSNQNDNAHIADVLDMATPEMQTWMLSQAGNATNAPYEGVTTRVIVPRLTEKTDSTATVHLDVQQELRHAEGTITMQQKTARVELLFVSGVWKISGMFWES